MQIFNNGLGVGLTGTTAQQLSELNGQVLDDAARDVVFIDPGTGQQVANAKVQDRVVRSNSTGRLDFYFRVTEFRRNDPSLTVALVSRGPFLIPPLDVDYRVDGLGDVGPITATWPPAGADLEFSFWPPAEITPDKLSRFVYVRSDATHFAETGFIALGLAAPVQPIRWTGTVHAFAPPGGPMSPPPPGGRPSPPSGGGPNPP